MAGGKAASQIILALSLPRDAEAIAALPTPDHSTFADHSELELKEVLEHLRDLWRQIVDEDIFDTDLSDPDFDEWERRRGPFWATLRSIATYHGYVFAQYCLHAEPASVMPFLLEPDYAEQAEPDEESLAEMVAEVQRLAAKTALLVHLTCWLGLMLALRVDAIGFLPGELPEDHDSDLVALDSLAFLEGQEKHQGELLRLYMGLFPSALWFRREVVRKRAQRRRESMQASSTLRSSRELRLLAARSPLMRAKYGSKKVERVFEEELALTFRSFGFTVVPARSGEAGADLLCISREAKYCFLVDAKSSTKPYTLPKSDQRALEEYATDFFTGLPDLPELKFILIVGASAGKTLESRLKELELRVQRPVRFATAHLIGTVRDRSTGPVIPGVFKESILRSDPLLSVDLSNDLREASEGLAATYTEFIARLKSFSGH